MALVFVCCLVAHAKKKPPEKPVDLNTATIEELQQIPEIGPATAKAIVNFRQKSGPFKRVEDLLAIPRISKAKLEKIRPYVKIGDSTSQEAGKTIPPAKKP